MAGIIIYAMTSKLCVLWCKAVHNRCGQHTVTFSKSASEQEGERGLTGLREGELPTLETYSGSGTYRTCKHKPSVFTRAQPLCRRTHMHARGDERTSAITHRCACLNRHRTWNHMTTLRAACRENKIGATSLELDANRLTTAKSRCKQFYQPWMFTGISLSKQ